MARRRMSEEQFRAKTLARWPDFERVVLDNPLSDTGVHYGITRERVRQIARRCGLPTFGDLADQRKKATAEDLDQWKGSIAGWADERETPLVTARHFYRHGRRAKSEIPPDLSILPFR